MMNILLRILGYYGMLRTYQTAGLLFIALFPTMSFASDIDDIEVITVTGSRLELWQLK